MAEGEADTSANKEEYDKKKKTKKTKEEIEMEALEGDFYGLLDLEDKNEATEASIRKAYKKATLKFHPDKVRGGDEEKVKAMWLKVQEAYDTLTDPVRRRKYDSSLPFDDSLPEEAEFKDAKAYMEAFMPVF